MRDNPIGEEHELLLALLCHASRRKPSQEFILGELLDFFRVPRSYFPRISKTIVELEAETMIVTSGDDEDIYNTFVRISLPGHSHLRANYGDNSDIVLFRAGFSAPTRIPGEFANPDAIDSSRWTGVASRKFNDPKFVERVSSHITRLQMEIEESDLSNSEKACLNSIVKAVTALLESPNPEWRIIADLLRSPIFGVSMALLGAAQFILGMII